MSIIQSGVKAHDDACMLAEGVHQAATSVATNQAEMNAANIAYLRAVVTSARKHGLQDAVFVQALHELGIRGA
jgi:hypothetical protein